MKIIINLSHEESNRDIEAYDGKNRAAYQQIIKELENICCDYQIRYDSIEVIFGDKK